MLLRHGHAETTIPPPVAAVGDLARARAFHDGVLGLELVGDSGRRAFLDRNKTHSYS